MQLPALSTSRFQKSNKPKSVDHDQSQCRYLNLPPSSSTLSHSSFMLWAPTIFFYLQLTASLNQIARMTKESSPKVFGGTTSNTVTLTHWHPCASCNLEYPTHVTSKVDASIEKAIRGASVPALGVWCAVSLEIIQSTFIPCMGKARAPPSVLNPRMR